MSGIREAAGILSRIPPLWIVTLLLAAWSCWKAARQGRERDALLLLMMLLSCVACVVYLCAAGDVL